MPKFSTAPNVVQITSYRLVFEKIYIVFRIFQQSEVRRRAITGLSLSANTSKIGAFLPSN